MTTPLNSNTVSTIAGDDDAAIITPMSGVSAGAVGMSADEWAAAAADETGISPASAVAVAVTAARAAAGTAAEVASALFTAEVVTTGDPVRRGHRREFSFGIREEPGRGLRAAVIRRAARRSFAQEEQHLEHREGGGRGVEGRSNLSPDGEHWQVLDVASFMHKAPLAVQADFPATRVHVMFCTLGLRHLTVTDAGNRVLGIVTRKDVMRAAEG